MTMTSPLRGPKNSEGGGFAAAHFPARRACYGAAPPAPRVLRIALRATAPAGLPLSPETTAAPGPGRAGRPGLPPRCARRANPRRGGASVRQEQLNWRSIVKGAGKLQT